MSRVSVVLAICKGEVYVRAFDNAYDANQWAEKLMTYNSDAGEVVYASIRVRSVYVHSEDIHPEE